MNFQFLISIKYLMNQFSNNNKTSYFNGMDDKPSRFLVDLKKIAEEKEDKRREESEKKKMYFFAKLDQLAAVSLFKFIFAVFKKIYKLRGWLHSPVRAVELKCKSLSEVCIMGLHRAVPLWSRRVAVPLWSQRVVCSAAVKSFKKCRLKIKSSLPMPEGEVRRMWKLRPVIAFTLALCLLVLPLKAYTYYSSISGLKGKILGASETAVSELLKAGKSASELDFNQAERNFTLAGGNFLQAQNELNSINDFLFILASLAPNKDLKLAADAKHILAAGRAAAELGGNLSLAADSLFNNDGGNIKEIIDNFYYYGGKAAANAEDLNCRLAEVNIANLPEEYREQFNEMREKSIFIAKNLNEIVDLIEKARIFLGSADDKRYLLVFQNNTEMRATGGFIGSFALIDFRNGKIKNIEAPGGGSYDTEAGLYEKVKAPEPLWLVNPLWHFWDANWWPDWPTSARKLMWFYEKSDGPTVDGVISFTPTVIERMLEIIGPIDMAGENYNITIDADNFLTTVQELAEQKPDVTKQPKKIIGDLMVEILDELPKRLNKGALINLLGAMEDSLNEKHILFYFTDDELQKKIENYGWGGNVKQTAWNYLAVINTNIGGGKSDKSIEEEISHETEILPDGSIINTLEIKRTHTGRKGEQFSGVRNVDWMRIYVPQGSELISASGFKRPADIYFEEPDPGWQDDPDVYAGESAAKTDKTSGTEIYNEAGKTVFANWSMADPGQTAVIYLKYKLPFKLAPEENEGEKQIYPNTFGQSILKKGAGIKDLLLDKAVEIFNPGRKQLLPYALLAQKQAGSKGDKITSTLKLPDNFKIVWSYPENAAVETDGWNISGSLNTDKYWAVLIEN